MARGNGEGNIRRRKDGRWEARMTVGYQGDKAQIKSLYGKTRQEVQQKLSKLQTDLQQGIAPTDDRQTVGQFLDRWLKVSVKGGVRSSTYVSYEGHVRLHIKPALGKIRLSKLTPVDVQEFMNEKISDGLSAQTVRNVRATLRAALGQAVRWGEVSRNVVELTDPPSVPHNEPDPFTAGEAAHFLETTKEHRLHAVFSLMLACGMRRGEALGLRWRDMDLEGGTLSIRHSLQRIDGSLKLVEPKTAKSRRTIAIPGFAWEALKAHRKRQVEEKLFAGSKWQDTDHVFTSRIGTPLDPDNVSRDFKALVKEAGLRDQRLHDLRHACASLLMGQGVSPRVVMETLGHSQISLTMNTYSHVIPDLQRNAANQMDEIMTSTSRK